MRNVKNFFVILVLLANVLIFSLPGSVWACQTGVSVTVTGSGSDYTAQAQVVGCASGSTVRFRVYKDSQIYIDSTRDDVAITGESQLVSKTFKFTENAKYSFELFQSRPESKVLGLKAVNVIISQTPTATPNPNPPAATPGTQLPQTPPSTAIPTTATPTGTTGGSSCGRLNSNFSEFGGGVSVSSLLSTRCYSTGGLITKIIQWLLSLAGSLAVLILVYGGYRYMTSAGNSEAITSAKKIMQWALVGLVVVLLAYTIVVWVSKLFVSGEIF